MPHSSFVYLYMFIYEYLIGVKPEIHGFTPKKQNFPWQFRYRLREGTLLKEIQALQSERAAGDLGLGWTRVKCLDFGSRNTDFWVTYATYIYIVSYYLYKYRYTYSYRCCDSCGFWWNFSWDFKMIQEEIHGYEWILVEIHILVGGLEHFYFPQ